MLCQSSIFRRVKVPFAKATPEEQARSDDGPVAIEVERYHAAIGEDCRLQHLPLLRPEAHTADFRDSGGGWGGGKRSLYIIWREGG